MNGCFHHPAPTHISPDNSYPDASSSTLSAHWFQVSLYWGLCEIDLSQRAWHITLTYTNCFNDGLPTQLEKDTSRNLQTNVLNLLHRVWWSERENINSFCWSWGESPPGVKIDQDNAEMRDWKGIPTPVGIDWVPITSWTLYLPFSVILKHNFQQRKEIIRFFSSPYHTVFSFLCFCRISLINCFLFSSLFHKWFLVLTSVTRETWVRGLHTSSRFLSCLQEMKSIERQQYSGNEVASLCMKHTCTGNYRQPPS